MTAQPPQELYSDLMEEAKARILLIGHMLEGRMLTEGIAPPPAIIREFGYLQLRMLCEVVALSCLVAHGDIKETQSPKIRRLWKADEIIDALEKLHPDFYPHATHFRIATSTDGRPAITIDHSKKGGLTKDELIDLYGKSGDRLHRGNIKKLVASPSLARMNPTHSDFAQIAAFTNKFTALLETHVISSADMRKHFICWLSDSRNNGRVSVVLAVR